MPIYVYWGEDDFAIEKAVAALCDRILDPLWTSFNYSSLLPDQADAVIQGLNEVMTPSFGAGGRLVWLVNTTLCQHCPDNVLAELTRTLPVIPENSFLLLTSRNKPDERLKSTKFLKQQATEFREFPLIPPWKTELLVQAVHQAAHSTGVKLTAKAMEVIAESVGNDTRLLYNEMEKLRLYGAASNQPLDVDSVTKLVRNTTQNSLQLAAAIRNGDTAQALATLSDLINASEPGLRIVATLIGQFRTWLWVKIMMESGERNPQEIAKAAEIGNPKRIYFLQQEVKFLSVQQLISILPLLLDLEVSLKQGYSDITTLQTKVIELCQVARGSRA
ncbi:MULTISPECIES: DNA polymerase III subunit delta [unclassified Tolypothrix]|uniref:DNA polymerase III subunit delta n=1 Tax=unclassified Tolypothrix TaxID=2649714 RepID=UPI0005EAC478|nr:MULTISPECIES: DNA polymerase III subunit delta [unclassified Tolypothrix]BAY89091.1 DNA polymerase III subunit delta [Microchaete diplosiphon NIES-3275]EKF06252.1 DNA-directed DNA polymerase III [Tolypothrix sp. PCC 7601]MBE9087939.1 DNA polymerase III subunit delta [Tolypothrix sp. LEGE 11397]UYD29713.1 DNA polymerase III subunit delta [Tolypothrix sp. PCC 7712]UYD34370.1 DNA polymerase III subunit delta [Tolypothrix sp. PCC 7601]